MLDVLEIFLNYHAHTYLRLDGATPVQKRQVTIMADFHYGKNSNYSTLFQPLPLATSKYVVALNNTLKTTLEIIACLIIKICRGKVFNFLYVFNGEVLFLIPNRATADKSVL